MRRLDLFVTVIVLILASTATYAQQPQFTINHLAGDVYEFLGGGRGTFMITPDGAIVADPVDVETAEWLQAEIRERFDQPVTHVLYSHFHWDHVSGGAVYEDATVIAHANTVKNLMPQPQDAPLRGDGSLYYDGRFGDWDARGNNDGLVQIDEMTPREGALLADYDLNGDGGLSLDEISQGQHRDVRVPDETYDSDVHRLTVGGKTVEMHYVPSRHSDDLSFIFYPEERVLMVVDIISLGRLPWNNMGWYDADLVSVAIEKALSFDAEIVVPGHGDVGGRKGVADFYAYIQALKAGVAAGIASGQSLDEIKATLLLEDYSNWGMYGNWRLPNIDGMYAYLTRED